MNIRIRFLTLALFSFVFVMGTGIQSAKADYTGEAHSHGEEKSRTELRRDIRKQRAEDRQRIESRQNALQDSIKPDRQPNSTAQDSNKTLIYRGQKKSTAGKRIWNRY